MKKRHQGYHPDQRELRRLLGLGPRAHVPKLTLLANAESERSGDAHEVFIFQKASGGHGTIRIPRDQAYFDPKAVARAIVAKNGILPRDLEKAAASAAKASAQEPHQRWLEVEVDGWRPDMRAFVHRGRVIGQRRVGKALLKAPSSITGRNYPLARKGHLQAWRRMLRIARFSSRMRLAVCAAFGAPLLRVVDLQSFMLVIFGPSKAGKSTVQLAAASVIGIGQEGALPNFNATLASLQEVATEFNDSVLPVNEIGLLQGTKREAYPSLRPLIYRYSEGRDTGRHSKSTFASASGLGTWRGIMVASSENSIEALAELGGHKRDEGEYARAFDVPAVRPGNKTVYDRFPRHIAPEHREAWARRQLVDIRALGVANHGLAFHRYAKFLVGNRTVLKLDVERAMARFMATLPKTSLSGALQHSARNFALTYAGAVLAKRAGLLPWNLAVTRRALQTCFLDGVHEIAQTEGAEDRVRKLILERLSTLRPIASVEDVHEVEGWYEESRTGRTFAIPTPRFNEWFMKPEERRAALRWLHRNQLLELTDGAKPDWPRLAWAVTFPKIGGKGQRCYRFRDPRGIERHAQQ